MSTKSELKKIQNEWKSLGIVESFPNVHHFSSNQFRAEPPSLRVFVGYCARHAIQDENCQTVKRALHVSNLVKQKKAIDYAIKESWREYPVCRRGLELVASINEVLLNAQAFSGIDKDSSSKANERFSSFFHWYYFPDIDVFAPSKFIGYKNTTLDNYRGDDRGEEHGTETQTVLKKLECFEEISSEHKEYEKLKEKLSGFAKSIGKEISSKTFDEEKSGRIYILKGEYSCSDYPDEVPPSSLKEGSRKQVTVNAFERNPKARAACIEKFGAKCCVCDFEFQDFYGTLGAGFIHVHHLFDLAKIGKEYTVDPIKDLKPVCPNCHAMLHKRKPAMHPEDLQKIIAKHRKTQ